MPENTNASTYDIQPFDPDIHDRTAFSCGVERTDNYLKLSAKKYQAGDFARVFVATDEGGTQIRGFYAINAHSIDVGELPKKLTRDAPGHGAIPAAYLSMIGVDKSTQGQGLGTILLADALKRILKSSADIGLKLVVLDVLDDGDEESVKRRGAFYLKMGFQSFPSSPSRMFIPLATVRKAFPEQDEQEED